MELKFTIISAVTLFLASLLVLACWLSLKPPHDLGLSVPGLDGRPVIPRTGGDGETVSIGEYFAKFADEAPDPSASWPMFRGAGRDNIVPDGAALADSWPESGPEELWRIELGEGHAAPAVYNGRVYVLDYLEEEKADALRCFSLDDGRELWRRWYDVHVKRNHGMSRTVPAVNGRFVVTIGPLGHVMCCDAITGEFLWGIDLVRDFGSKIPGWYTGQCPLLDGDTVILAPSGPEVMMLGVDLASGESVWRTPNPGSWTMSHSSIMPMNFAGRNFYVYSAVGGICGVAADGNEPGKLLWHSTAWDHNVIAPSPVCMPDGRIFCTAGYGGGSAMLQLRSSQNGSFSVEKTFAFSPGQGLASEQQTPILWRNHLFGILPKDGGTMRQEFVCYHSENLAQVVWNSGKTERFGLGPYLLADGKFIVLNDNGELTMLRASEKEYIVLARAKVLDGHDAWGPLVVVDGKLLLRDSRRMICLDIGKK